MPKQKRTADDLPTDRLHLGDGGLESATRGVERAMLGDHPYRRLDQLTQAAGAPQLEHPDFSALAHAEAARTIPGYGQRPGPGTPFQPAATSTGWPVTPGIPRGMISNAYPANDNARAVVENFRALAQPGDPTPGADAFLDAVARNRRPDPMTQARYATGGMPLSYGPDGNANTPRPLTTGMTGGNVRSLANAPGIAARPTNPRQIAAMPLGTGFSGQLAAAISGVPSPGTVLGQQAKAQQNLTARGYVPNATGGYAPAPGSQPQQRALAAQKANQQRTNAAAFPAGLPTPAWVPQATAVGQPGGVIGPAAQPTAQGGQPGTMGNQLGQLFGTPPQAGSLPLQQRQQLVTQRAMADAAARRARLNPGVVVGQNGGPQSQFVALAQTIGPEAAAHFMQAQAAQNQLNTQVLLANQQSADNRYATDQRHAAEMAKIKAGSAETKAGALADPTVAAAQGVTPAQQDEIALQRDLQSGQLTPRVAARLASFHHSDQWDDSYVPFRSAPLWGMHSGETEPQTFTRMAAAKLGVSPQIAQQWWNQNIGGTAGNAAGLRSAVRGERVTPAPIPQQPAGGFVPPGYVE